MNLANPDFYITLFDYFVLFLISLLLILLSAILNTLYFAFYALLQICTFRYILFKQPLIASLYAANSKTFPIFTYIYCAVYIYSNAFKLRRQYNTLRDLNLFAFYNIATLGNANSL